MKLIVDEMPIKNKDCLFSTPSNLQPSAVIICKFTNDICKVEEGKCDYLIPITDYCTEEIIERFSDIEYSSKRLNITRR